MKLSARIRALKRGIPKKIASAPIRHRRPRAFPVPRRGKEFRSQVVLHCHRDLSPVLTASATRAMACGGCIRRRLTGPLRRITRPF